jgi:hypothetical protein
VTVRSTSIAGVRRAVTISGPGPSRGFRALQRFALLAPGGGALWDSLGVGGAVVLQRNAAGTLTHLPTGDVWGRFGSPTGLPGGVLTRVGEGVAATPAPGTIRTGETYVPIARVIGGVETLIGFGRVSVSGVTATSITVTKLRGIADFGGVSAIDPIPLARLGASAVLSAAHSAFSEPMLAPVLTR